MNPLHLLGVSSHAAVPARVNWFPWTDEDRVVIGWRGQVYDSEDQVFMYLSPALDSSVPMMAIFIGPHGNPTRDRLVGLMTQTGVVPQ